MICQLYISRVTPPFRVSRLLLCHWAGVLISSLALPWCGQSAINSIHWSFSSDSSLSKEFMAVKRKMSALHVILQTLVQKWLLIFWNSITLARIQGIQDRWIEQGKLYPSPVNERLKDTKFSWVPLSPIVLFQTSVSPKCFWLTLLSHVPNEV